MIDTLIIEDDPPLAALMARWLAPVADEVRIAPSMAEALQIMAQWPSIILVTLDLNLPDSRAVDTLARIPAMHKLRPEALIIVVTGVIDPAQESRVLAGGADGYVSKTLFHGGQVTLLQTLRAVVASVIQRPNRYQQSVALLETVATRIAQHLTAAA